MKPNLSLTLLLLLAWSPVVHAVQGDADNDGLRDEVETGTGVYVSPTNTGTNPNKADTDGDSVPDGLEINHGTNPTDATSKRSRPNIILINCDDLGYGDIGCFWQNQKTGTQKFATPGIDAMAAEGIKLTHHYVAAPICASSRASLMQGRHQGHADLRDRAFDWALPNNHSMGSVLQAGGYRTVHVGKAGLCGTGVVDLPAHPLLRGFDRFFGYYSHYHAQEHYPQNGNNTRTAAIYDDYRRVTDAYVDLYTTDVWTGFTKKTIIEETQTHPERPFFIYLAYDAPHFDNEMPPTLDYPAGRGINGGIQWTGAPSYVSTASNDPAKINSLSNQHSSVNPAWPQYAREHVTMIRRIDDSVADILQTLRDLHIDNNTIVVFTSDNGPDSFKINPVFFQGYANFEGIKGDIWEGGLRVPTIVWWPGHVQGSNDLSNILANPRPSANYDWLATFAEIGGIPAPAFTDGVSILPSLTGSGTQRDKGFLYFEYDSPNGYTGPIFPNHGGERQEQSQAIRIGDFMGVRNNVAGAADNFRIYNVVSDPKQSTNLAAAKPELQAKMKELAVGARRPNASFPRPYDTAPIPASPPASLTNGLKYECYEGYWNSLPEFNNLTHTAGGATAYFDPSVRTRPNDAGIAFTGYISIPATGSYTFNLGSDSGAGFWIHEGHVIDNDALYSATKTSAPVYLAQGLHPVRLYYRHLGGAPVLTLKYSGPGFAMTTVPASALFTEGPTPVFQTRADSAFTKKNISVTIDPLANDSSNYPLTLSAVTSGRSGTTQISSGKVVYQPDPDFVGSDTFSYTEVGGAATASGMITTNVLFGNESWIPLDEGGGTSVQVIDANHPTNGTLAGTVGGESSWKTGKYAKCVEFDGLDDQIDFPDMLLPAGSSPRTFTCWVKTAASATDELQTLFSYGTAMDGQRFSVRLDNIPGAATDHPLRLEVQGGNIVGSRKINDGQWHHVAVVVGDRDNDGRLNVSEVLLYVDGILDTARSAVPMEINTVSGINPALGGSNHASNYNFTGSIDDVRIFPAALSGAEIASIRTTRVNYIYVPDNSDLDGDGVGYDAEIRAGTDPNNPGSVFKVTSWSEAVSGDMTLRWSAVGGKTYFVEESLDMKTWIPVPNIPAYTSENDNPDASITFPKGSDRKCFFRLGVK